MMLLGKKESPQKSAADLEVRRLLKAIVKESGQSREQIAEGMSSRIGKTISKRKLDAWIAPRKRLHLPAAYIDAFCEAVGNDDLRRHVLGERLRQLLELGEKVEPVLKTAVKKRPRK